MTLLNHHNEIQSLLSWGFAFAALTILFVVLEIFIPSGGILMIIAICATAASIISFFMADATTGTIALVSYAILGPTLGWVGFRFWASSSLSKKMILREDTEGKTSSVIEDPMSAFDKNEQENLEKHKILKSYIGKTATTDGVLRPVGAILLDEKRINAISERGFIESGIEVEIVDAYDNQLKVRPIQK